MESTLKRKEWSQVFTQKKENGIFERRIKVYADKKQDLQNEYLQRHVEVAAGDIKDVMDTFWFCNN